MTCIKSLLAFNGYHTLIITFQYNPSKYIPCLMKILFHKLMMKPIKRETNLFILSSSSQLVNQILSYLRAVLKLMVMIANDLIFLWICHIQKTIPASQFELEFLTGYSIESSISNILVAKLIFAWCI